MCHGAGPLQLLTLDILNILDNYFHCWPLAQLLLHNPYNSASFSARAAEWHAGSSLAQTVYASLYMLLLDRCVRACVHFCTRVCEGGGRMGAPAATPVWLRSAELGTQSVASAGAAPRPAAASPPGSCSR